MSSSPGQELSRCLQCLRAARNKLFWAQRHGERFNGPLSKSIDEKETELKEQAGGDLEQFFRLRNETREQQIFESIRQRLKKAESEIRKIWASMRVPLDQLRSLETSEVFRALDSLSPNPVLHTDRIIALVERALRLEAQDAGKKDLQHSQDRPLQPSKSTQKRHETEKRQTEPPKQLIDRLRKERGWTIEKLAGEAGVDIKQVYTIKRGENVTVETLKKIARALGCQPGDLISG